MSEKYKDVNLSIEERIDDLISRMTLKQKMSLYLQQNTLKLQRDCFKRLYQMSILHTKNSSRRTMRSILMIFLSSVSSCLKKTNTSLVNIKKNINMSSSMNTKILTKHSMRLQNLFQVAIEMCVQWVTLPKISIGGEERISEISHIS